MTIKWVGANINNYGFGRGGHQIKYVVYHWIVGTLSSADVTFNSPTRLASAHYGVGPTEVHQFVNEKDTAYHAGDYLVNQESIGIEHQGGPDLPIEEGTIKNSAELLASICKRYNIPLDRTHIKLHREIKPTQCPGTLDVDRIIQLAKGVTEMPVFTDQTKIPVGGDFGEIELQALRSILNDQRRDIASMKVQIADLNKKVAELSQVPTTPVFTNPTAILFLELAKVFDKK